ncbi:MAG TPA: hypothetical protein DCE42_00195 [Myxococcales bacterium]|nr:hypothetical protein [Deltaproteobacteria bacterium]HAA53140.1 hypothetical protein [Myxococcales bacterium]
MGTLHINQTEAFMADESLTSLHCPSCGWKGQGEGRFCPSCGRDLRESSPADPLIGEVIQDRYRISRTIGRGGMGVVYQVEHIVMGKVMAMKLLHARLTQRPNAVKRFRQEIKVVSRLSHINTISVFDCGVMPDGGLFIVMEYLRGFDVERLIQHERFLPCLRAALIAKQVCASLAEAHNIGVIHRDIKPANIMLLREQGEQDFVKVLDFGIAKLVESDHEAVTEIGLIVGTPFYMAPEQAMGSRELGPGVDIYSLGVVLYEMITGRLPFQGETTSDFIEAHLRFEPVPPSLVMKEQAIDTALEEIILRCMKKDPKDRFSSIEAMQAALERYIEGVRTRHAVDLSSSVGQPAVSMEALSASSVDVPPEPADTPKLSLAVPEEQAPVRKTAPFKRDDELAQEPTESSPQEVGRLTVRRELREVSTGESETPGPEDSQSQWTFGEPPSADSEPSIEQLATRADWDAVEWRWKLRAQMRFFLPLLVFLGLSGWGGYMLWTQYQKEYVRRNLLSSKRHLVEQEPNNKLIHATRIILDKDIQGELGQRLGQGTSDRDWFSFTIPKGTKRVVSITLKPPSTIDVELGLYTLKTSQEGSKIRLTPYKLRAVNLARRGGEETIPTYRLSEGRYFVLVRELLVMGEPPQESQGKYTLRVQQLTLTEQQEAEPNDQMAQAWELKVGVVYSGLHDRLGDIDFSVLQLPARSNGKKQRYQLVFYSLRKSKPTLLVLDGQGTPLSVSKRTRSRRVVWPPTLNKRRKGKKRACRVHTLRFSTKGKTFIRLSDPNGFDVKEAYYMVLQKR